MPPKQNYNLLKHENDELKKNVQSMVNEVKELKDRLTQFESRSKEDVHDHNSQPTEQDIRKSIDFISDEYDDIVKMCKSLRKDLSNINSRLSLAEE